jgi:ubiquinone/menaquinone biosynthesis C-methylase UbiE
MIKYAKEVAKNTGSNIDFKILDASNLTVFENETFDYLIYLQQVLCFIEKEDLFIDALKEAYRIAKKDGIIIFSFLDFNSRISNSTLSRMVNILRKFRNENISRQYLPWLKTNGKINWKFFNKNQAVTYWVKREQIVATIEETGFSIVEVKNTSQLTKPFEKTRKGMLYIICSK